MNDWERQYQIVNSVITLTGMENDEWLHDIADSHGCSIETFHMDHTESYPSTYDVIFNS